MTDAWNPYFVAYANAHGLQPQAILDRDKRDNECACMMPFMLWQQERRYQWRKSNGFKSDYILSEDQERVYGAWLEADSLRPQQPDLFAGAA